MQLPKDAVTTLASQGYMTLQVPQMSISFSGAPAPVESVDDEHIIEVKGYGYSHKQRIVAGREYGFSYLSRKGFNHYFNDLKAVFRPSRGTWQDFVDNAHKTLDEIEAETRKEIAKLQALQSVDPKPARAAKAKQLAKELKKM